MSSTDVEVEVEVELVASSASMSRILTFVIGLHNELSRPLTVTWLLKPLKDIIMQTYW